MAPIAIAINVANASYQKEFVSFSFSKSAYGKFVEISMETFIKVFLLLKFFCLLNLNGDKERALSGKL